MSKVNRAEPWQKAEIAGPQKALVITKPEIVAALIKRSKLPIFVIGHKASEVELGEEKEIDSLIRVAKASGIEVVATAHTIKEFIERGFKPAASMPAMDIANRLKDPDWKGLNGKGPYDIALFAGFPYYMEWLILSGLKNFAPYLKTVSLGRFYQPHASWSFTNRSVEKWRKNLEVIENNLR